MKIPIGSDHAGFETKELIIKILEELGHTVQDEGTYSADSVDYPEYAVKVSEQINSGDFELGILVCGSGQGVCMTANKFPNVRAALVYNSEVAELTKQHNNANIMCIPGRSIDLNELKSVVENFIKTPFEGGRHQRRVNKIKELTQN